MPKVDRSAATSVEFQAPTDREEDANVALAFVGTCQSCGAYWDVRKQPVCACGGEVL